MEKSGVLVALVTVLTAGSINAIEEDSLACCPPGTFIIRDICYDPEKNTTQPMRITCNVEWGNVSYWQFKVNNGNIEIKRTPVFSIKFSSDVACYGNATNSNMTRFHPKATICIIKNLDGDDTSGDAFVYCTIVSVVFLAITAIIYAAFHELRDLFGTSAINFCGSLAIGLGIYSIILLNVPENQALCATQGFLAYFFMMAAFFWTNSISIEVLRDTRRPCTVDYGWKELRWYMLYSWGSPAILTTIMAIVNYHPGEHDRPGIGLNHCWFLNITQQWYYMFSVMAILLFINFAIFTYIATIIWQLTLSSTPIKALKFKLSLTFRLILLMGLPWIFEMISAAVGGSSVLKIITDIAVSLQGILIFLVLVLRKRVVKVLHQRGLLNWCSGAVERWLTVADDAETNVVHHTDVPLREERLTNGNGQVE